MAVGVTAGTAPATEVRRVKPHHFVCLKLRILANNLRGRASRMALFLLGAFFGLSFAVSGFFLFATGGLMGDMEIALVITAFGGGLLVLGWLFFPLLFFGVDETLDPARFALLPLSRRTLVTGQLAAALVGLPPLALLIATAGIVVSAALLGGWLAGLGAAAGVVAGLLLCVTVSRAVTSAFATMLRSRRVRDLAAFLLALLAALLGPLQIAGLNVLTRTDWDALADVAHVLAWTPLAAPYTVGFDLAENRPGAALLKLATTGVVIGLLLWWWSRSLESAMVGATGGGAAPSRRGAAGGAVDQLFPRALFWMPRNRYGALVAREVRYWWRETRQRAGLITLAVVGVFVPAMFTFGGNMGGTGQVGFATSLTMTSLSMLFVGALAAVTLANQFGYDGSAYAANVVAGVPGKVELQSRIVAVSVYLVPLQVAIAVGVGLFLGEPTWIPAMIGTVLAAYGSGLAINLYVSVLGAYALPETSNPFAVNSGTGTAKGLLSFLSMIGGGVAAVPVMVATVLLGDAWMWLALPVGLGYGFGAAALGAYLAGDVLDHRTPELLSTITPRS